ncbi:MAG: hypothetical protein HY934_04760, partial [Candidatus Firestonebacteria bacterium]|nr:hypothetical protein [Candidatus Firestonebacteria bacterium]
MNKIKRIKLIILIINLIGVFTSRVSYAKVYGSISGRVYLEQTGQGVEGCIIEAFAGLNLESVTEKNFYELVDSGE